MHEFDPLNPQPGRRSPVVVAHEGFGVDHDGRDIFFAAVETTRMPMIITDPREPDNPIVFANQAFVNMTGYAFDELRGRNCRLLQGPDTDRGTIAEVRAAIAAQREIAVEVLNYRKDGSSFWNALFVSPVRNRQGDVVYCFASQLDVSRRRDAEDALRQAQKMEALGQLTGGIAHDFNNLLQVIVGHLDLMTQRVGSTAEPMVTKSLGGIREATRKAGTLTQQLLAFARKQQLKGRVINLNDLADTFMELGRRTVGSDIRIEAQLEPRLWNCRLDPTQTELALLNILLNARDAMPGGGTVTLATANVQVDGDNIGAYGVPMHGAYVMLSIADTGTGIAPELLPRVMDPFFTTKDEGAGTGLGLSMVYGFAKQSGGSVSLQSESGAGTTVRLYFPATEAPVPVTLGTRAPAGTTGHERVLIVDDRAEVAEMTQLMLSALGYDASACHGPAEALAILGAESDYDLLLTDLIMPGGINGVMLARQARRLRPGLKILLTTGFADATLDRAGGADEFDVIFKPYGQADLGRKVRLVLDGPTGVG